MQKEELIYIHTVLVQVKRFIESEGIEADFSEYEAMQISPVHVHRSKNDHKAAIFILSDEIGRAMQSGKLPAAAMLLGKKDLRSPGNIKGKGLAGLKA